MDSALKNFVIVTEIARHLNFQQLTSCRLVNKEWDELFSIIMGKRAVIRFHPPKSSHLDTCLSSLKHWNVDFESQVNFMERLNIGNIRLNLYQSRAPQVREDMCWLLDYFADQIKCLVIEMRINNGRDGALLFKILKQRLGALVQLDLRIAMNCKTLKLPSSMETVRVLKIRGIYGFDFMTRIISTPHNDAALSPFPNLRTLEIHGGTWRGEFPIKLLQTLTTFPKFGLENLVIYSLRFDQRVFNALREALERQAPTLQSLRLDWVDFRQGGTFDFLFPHFHKLKKLEWNTEWFESNNGGTLALALITWRFPRGQVFYKYDFPLLEDLKIGLIGTKLLAKDVLETFVALGTHQKCHTMKRIHFDMTINWGDPADKLWISEFWKVLQIFFLMQF